MRNAALRITLYIHISEGLPLPKVTQDLFHGENNNEPDDVGNLVVLCNVSLEKFFPFRSHCFRF